MDDLLPALAAFAAAQSGLFTRAQALEAGYDARDVRWATGDTGPWVVVRRGVYAVAADHAQLDHDQVWQRLDSAVHLAGSTDHVLSHDSAAQLLGLPLVGFDRSLSHLTRPGVGGSRTQHGVKHHLGTEQPRDVTRVGWVPVTGLARTGLDLAREHGLRAGVVALDAGRRRSATMRAFELELALMTRWPHVRRARQALALSDPRAESPGESLARLLVGELGIGDVDLQFPVPVSGGVAYADLRVGRHLFEFDGRVKYRAREHGGVVDGDLEQVIWEEKRRQTEICALGLGISRIIWADLWGLARVRALQRLRAEYAVTERRYGRALPPDLVAFAAAHPRRWDA